MIHESAVVEDDTEIAESAKIWNWVQIRKNASVGENSIIGKGSYIDSGVRIGANVKIQNNVSVFYGVSIEDGVFIGPHVCFTNDMLPRAINLDGSIKTVDNWTVTKTRVCYGSSIGANSTIICGVTIGKYVMVGAGSVVTRDVPAFALVVGNPAKQIGSVCKCGNRLDENNFCSKCRITISLK